MIRVVQEKAHSPNAYQAGYQQAFNDLGVTQLSPSVTLPTDSGGDSSGKKFATAE